MGLNEGKIVINNKEICYRMDSENFINMFSCKINSYSNGDIERYNYKNPQIIDEVSFWIRIVFKNKIISSIELRNADPKLKNSYENWSNDKVELKRKSHDEWLINQLGQPDERKLPCIKYNYVWGEVLSCYDPRGGDIWIAINYNNKEI